MTLIPPILGLILLATIQEKNSPNTNYGILYMTSIATGSVGDINSFVQGGMLMRS